MEELNLKEHTIYSKENTVKVTFYITYAFLLTTATITFIEAMRNSVPTIRHILNLETCISVVAAFFYTQFMKKLKDGNEQKKNKQINYKEINVTRYTDWAITTPVMLLVLCLVLAYNNKSTVSAGFFFLVLILNYAMLASGYFGEVGKLNRRIGQIIGFVFFILLYGIIYYKFLYKQYLFDNSAIYWAFVIFWALYGVVYDLKKKIKIQLYFWIYFQNVLLEYSLGLSNKSNTIF